jgi:uncharacterized protein (DUF433 family)
VTDDELEADDARIAASIRQNGWHCIAVSGTDNEPPLAYTIGLCDRHAHPELVVRGLAGETAHALLCDLVAAIERGAQFRSGQTCMLVALPVAFEHVHARQQERLLGYAAAYYRKFADRGPLSALQVLWPDARNRLPDDADCDPAVFALQPRLAKAPTEVNVESHEQFQRIVWRELGLVGHVSTRNDGGLLRTYHSRAIVFPVQGRIMTELSTSEVAALFDLDERRVRKDVEYGVFERIESPPRFDLAEVVYLYTVAGIGLELNVEDRKKLYRMIAAAMRSKKSHDVELGAYLVVKVDAAVHDVEARLSEFEKWKKKLVQRHDVLGGEPVFPKSRLAVRHVGEMARRGASVEEIISDYPSLSKQDVEFAKRFVAAYPRVGRPRARETPAR